MNLWLINNNKCTTIVEDVDDGGSYACLGKMIYGKSLYLLFHFAVNLNHSEKESLLKLSKM